MISVGEIEVEVLRVLRTLLPGCTSIREDQRLIADLKLLSDDATAMILDLERKCRVKIPNEEWARVLTVQDVINVLAHHVK